METRWQLLLARLLEADQSHRSIDSHLLTAHQLKCFRKKTRPFISYFFYSPCFVWWSHLFSFPSGFVHVQLFSQPRQHTHSVSALVHRARGGILKEVSIRVIQRLEKDPNLDLIERKNKVASFCSMRDHDSLWVTWGNSSLSVHW